MIEYLGLSEVVLVICFIFGDLIFFRIFFKNIIFHYHIKKQREETESLMNSNRLVTGGKKFHQMLKTQIFMVALFFIIIALFWKNIIDDFGSPLKIGKFQSIDENGNVEIRNTKLTFKRDPERFLRRKLTIEVTELVELNSVDHLYDLNKDIARMNRMYAKCKIGHKRFYVYLPWNDLDRNKFVKYLEGDKIELSVWLKHDKSMSNSFRGLYFDCFPSEYYKGGLSIITILLFLYPYFFYTLIVFVKRKFSIENYFNLFMIKGIIEHELKEGISINDKEAFKQIKKCSRILKQQKILYNSWPFKVTEKWIIFKVMNDFQCVYIGEKSLLRVNGKANDNFVEAEFKIQKISDETSGTEIYFAGFSFSQLIFYADRENDFIESVSKVNKRFKFLIDSQKQYLKEENERNRDRISLEEPVTNIEDILMRRNLLNNLSNFLSGLSNHNLMKQEEVTKKNERKLMINNLIQCVNQDNIKKLICSIGGSEGDCSNKDPTMSIIFVCGHKMCPKCVKQLESNSCPFCRRGIDIYEMKVQKLEASEIPFEIHDNDNVNT